MDVLLQAECLLEGGIGVGGRNRDVEGLTPQCGRLSKAHGRFSRLVGDFGDHGPRNARGSVDAALERRPHVLHAHALAGADDALVVAVTQRHGAVAADLSDSGFDVDDHRRVLVDAEYADVGRKESLELQELCLAHVAEARVVPAALAVVVVGDDGGVQPGQGAEQVQAREPPRLLADLVDLVDGERVGSQGDRSSATHDERAAAVDDLGQADGHRSVDPLAQGVGGAAGAGEGPAGAADSSEGPLACRRRLVATAP